MMKTLGIVQVRREAEQLNWKIGRKLGGKSLLELVVRRVTDCQRLDGVLVLGDGHQDDTIRRLVPSDVPVLDGSARDPLARCAAAATHYRADAIVRVCTDNPFIDPVLIDRLANAAVAQPRCDYVGYCCADGRPAMLTHWGVFAEWCASEALLRVDREATRPVDREHVTRYLVSHPDRFRIRLIPLPPELDRDDLRLRIGVEEDWDHAQVIYEALGADECDWQKIADFLDHQPALRTRMALLNRAETTAR
jgi:spore coat polysaccharide biosynthesis protein SpsF (cytidylyltransferase family)